MRRRDFSIGLLLAATVGTVRAHEQEKQHRIAIVIPSGPVARTNDRHNRSPAMNLNSPLRRAQTARKHHCASGSDLSKWERNDISRERR
jgi:hypothetical protein